MRVNERELAFVATLKADREGRLNYRSPNAFREGYKERWFKLKGNLLFYFRLNEYGGVYEREPVGVFLIENCRIQLEQHAESAFAFSIVFLDDMEKKHMFSGPTIQHCEQWVKSLGEARAHYGNPKNLLNEVHRIFVQLFTLHYEHLRSKLLMLKGKIIQKEAQQQEPKQLYRPIPQGY